MRNANVPGDDDLSANGQITAQLNFANGPEFSRGSGSQILRLSSPTGRFGATQQAMTVTQAALAQQVAGTVSSSGSPLPFAWVGLLIPIGTDMEFLTATTADASGNFVLNVTNGSYVVIGFKPGYVGNFGTSPQVTISGASTNVTVPLTPAPLNLSGTLTDAGSGLGVPGVQFFATSGNSDYTAFFSDAQGNFSTPIISGQWKLEPSDFSASIQGYLRAQNKVSVSVGTVSVTGVNVPFTRATAMIYGTLKTDQGTPLPEVRLFAGDSGNLFESACYTDASGNYFLLASGTSGYFGPDGSGSGLPAGYVVQQVQLNLTNGQALQTNLVALRATAYLAGRAIDSNNNAIGGGNMIAFGPAGQNQNAQIAPDGSFVIPVNGGAWVVSLDTQTASSRNLVGPQLSLNVTDGVNVSNINYVAPLATRTISGAVRSATNSPISGLNVYASAMINGTNYNADISTDANGNYSLPVLAGVWSVGLDSQGLGQRGYPSVASQNVDTSTGNQTANFIVGAQPIGTIFFRETVGVVGEFGRNLTPTVTYAVTVKNYRVMLHVFNDTNPPAASSVLFTGPPGSGLTNSPADPAFGVVQDGTNVYYLSMAVHTPAIAPGGSWTVAYENKINTFNAPDPQVNSRLVVPLPTVAVSNGLLRSVSWSYLTPTGNAWPGTPSFIVTNRIDLFDQNGGVLDAEAFSPTMSYSYAAGSLFPWANIGAVRMAYYDTLTNQYFFMFSESFPSLTAAASVSGQTCQFLLNGPAGQNYTVQYSADLRLGTWTTLYVTNTLSSPSLIIDPSATNAARFYRVLVGP